MFIEKLEVKNFKKIKSQTYDLRQFDLLVGGNNSGKSTILQAMAIWQYCIDEFSRSPHNSHYNKIQIVLPNFSVLPIPEFSLIWHEKRSSQLMPRDKRSAREPIYIDIELTWRISETWIEYLGVRIDYQSPQAIFATPMGGWKYFRELEQKKLFPKIVYVPPFSGLEPIENWYDEGVIKQTVGKAQPGSVLRNLLFRVIDRDIPISENKDWSVIQEKIKEWFGVNLYPPQYEKGVSIEIKAFYQTENKLQYDIIAGGSGFHQILTLLAFLYGYNGVTTILLDEPDAHLHVNLQRQILNFFRKQKQVQFLIASHAEEFIEGVELNMVMSLLGNQPKRITEIAPVVDALARVDNMTIVETARSPFILYVEGEDDQRILSSWASVLGKEQILSQFHTFIMQGGSKKLMEDNADNHFKGLRQFNPNTKRMVLLDYDNDESHHPNPNNHTAFEWKRKNIDNYLLVSDAWKRTLAKELNQKELDDDTEGAKIIDAVFESENLTLPRGYTWQNVKANIFQLVDGKRILFSNKDALFNQLFQKTGLKLNRSSIALNMKPEELHEDIILFFDKLEKITAS